MDGYNPNNYGEIYPQKVHWNCTSKWAHHSFKLSGWIIKTQTFFESNSHDSSNVTTWGHDRIHPAYITFYLHYIICVFIPFQYIPWILAIFAIMSIHPGGFHSIPWNHFEIHIQIPHVPSKPSQFPPQIPWNRREIPIFLWPNPHSPRWNHHFPPWTPHVVAANAMPKSPGRPSVRFPQQTSPVASSSTRAAGRSPEVWPRTGQEDWIGFI